MNHWRFFILAQISAVSLAACSLHTVQIDPQPLQMAGGAYSLASDSTGAAAVRWYESFRDEKLAGLIEAGLQNNMDIRQAVARLEQADALYGQSRAGLFPAVDLEVSSSKSREDGESQEGASRVGAALSWEVDAFGRLRHEKTAGFFEKRAAAEDVEAVRLSLSAEVAEAYFNAVAQRLQLQLLQQQNDDDTKLLDLINQRFEAGVVANVEVLQQKSQLAENESLIPPAQAALRVFENRLDVLTGVAPDGTDRTAQGDVFAKIGALPVLGVPSDLLLHRPDLRALKNRLVAADADIGAAIADRLPRITLDGSYLYADGPAVSGPVTSVLAGLVQPLLDWGRREAEVRRNKAVYEEQLAAFTQAYLEALEDVENALYQENRQREFIARLQERANVLSQTLKASEATYKQGESDYLPVLDAVQNLRAVERNLIAQRLNLVLLRVQLFRALGGPIAPPPSFENDSNTKKQEQL